MSLLQEKSLALHYRGKKFPSKTHNRTCPTCLVFIFGMSSDLSPEEVYRGMDALHRSGLSISQLVFMRTESNRGEVNERVVFNGRSDVINLVSDDEVEESDDEVTNEELEEVRREISDSGGDERVSGWEGTDCEEESDCDEEESDCDDEEESDCDDEEESDCDDERRESDDEEVCDDEEEGRRRRRV